MAMYDLVYIKNKGGPIENPNISRNKTLREMIEEATAFKSQKQCYAVMIARQSAAKDAPFEYVDSDDGPTVEKVLPRHAKTMLDVSDKKNREGHPELFKEPT